MSAQEDIVEALAASWVNGNHSHVVETLGQMLPKQAAYATASMLTSFASVPPGLVAALKEAAIPEEGHAKPCLDVAVLVYENGALRFTLDSNEVVNGIMPTQNTPEDLQAAFVHSVKRSLDDIIADSVDEEQAAEDSAVGAVLAQLEDVPPARRSALLRRLADGIDEERAAYEARDPG